MSNENLPQNMGQNNNVVPFSELTQLEISITNGLSKLGLPTENIFLCTEDRFQFMKNIEYVLSKIEENKFTAVYMSKIIASICVGIPEAPLNYLWNETIIALRNNVERYGLDLFGTTLGRKISSQEEFRQVSDYDLLNTCFKISLIDEEIKQRLHYILWKRNTMSIAHPTHFSSSYPIMDVVSDLIFVVEKVIYYKIPENVLQVKQILARIKTIEFDGHSVEAIITELPFTANIDQLLRGIFSIYAIEDSEIARTNITKIAKAVWLNSSTDVKDEIAVKISGYFVNVEDPKNKLSKKFLEICNAQDYMPDSIKSYDIKERCSALITVHNGINNFYSEPVFAKSLYDYIIKIHGTIPKQVQVIYLKTLFQVFITNGNGTAWNAEPYYKQLLQQITNFPQQSYLLKLLFKKELYIYNDYQLNKFKELVSIFFSTNTKPEIVQIKEYLDKKITNSHQLEDTQFIALLQKTV